MKQNELQRRRRYRANVARLIKSKNQRGLALSAHASDRRGVLLLVVLSVLILFMLVGTTFLLTSNQYQTAAKIMDKANRTTFQPEDVLERALMQLVRDTNNRHSALRYHSLLRDLYGGDGFVGQVNTNIELPRYAGVTQSTPNNNALGQTNGQLVDLFVVDAGGNVLNDQNVVGLDLDSNGLPVEYSLSSTTGYYNGCLLTLMEGPCRGQSVRVVEYDFDITSGLGRLRVVAPERLDGRNLLLDTTGTGNVSNNALTDFYDTSTGAGYRFMVNGRPFNGTGVGYNAYANTGAARLTAYEAIQFLGEPIFGEVSLFPNSAYFTPTRIDPNTGGLLNNLYYAPTADRSANLTRDNTVQALSQDNFSLYAPNGGYQGPGDTDESYDAPDFQNMFLAHQALRSRFRGRVVDQNGASFDPAAFAANVTPNRLDLDGVTIPSLHRPALANFWFHRLFNSQWLIDEVNDPQARIAAVLDPYGQLGVSAPLVANQIAAVKRKFSMRPLREDHPNFNGSNPLSENQLAARFINNGSFLNATGEITAPIWETIGPWDVDNDGDGVPDSVWVDLGLPVQKTEDGRFYKPLVAMLVEDLDGRLNLNAHGTAEHLVNNQFDISDNLATAGVNDLVLDPFNNPDGANLAQDYNNPRALYTSDQLPLGSGWGPADISLRSILSPDLPLYDFNNGTALTNIDPAIASQYDDYARLLVGRPSPENAGRDVSRAVNVSVDFGRYGTLPGTSANLNDLPLYLPGKSATRKNGQFVGVNVREDRLQLEFPGYPIFAGNFYDDLVNQIRTKIPTAFGEVPDLKGRYASALSAIGNPVYETRADFNADRFDGVANFSLLDDSPYEIDLSAEARRGVPSDMQMVVDSSTGVSSVINEDALFSVAELERILRATDADATDLPDRLWNLVDAFDPEKMAVQQAITSDTSEAIQPSDVDNFPNFAPNTLQRVIAQSQTAINRRQVTTDSFDLPVPNENWTTRLLLGADGLPGVPAIDSDGNGNINVGDVGDIGDIGDIGDDNRNGLHDEGAELGFGTYTPADNDPNNDSDDYQVIMGQLPPSGARITDYLRYRVTLELLRNGTINASTNAARINSLVNQIIFGNDAIDASSVRNDLVSFGGILAPEVLAGKKMNINRPLGDGRDNNNNGVVDEPAEAGDTYTYVPNANVIDVQPLQDVNGNGVFDQDINNNNRLYRLVDTNLDGQLDTYAFDDTTDLDGNGTFEPVVDNTWIDHNGNGVAELEEFHPFVHSQGRDINGRGSTADSGNLLVADDAPLARQYLARHLYCLMLTLVDENYLAPYDSNDPQVLHYLDPFSRGSVAFRIRESLVSNPPPNYPWPGYAPITGSAEEIRAAHGANARRIALRKLTCRQIAQWAINCVDIRDADSIQTPFEYDENPWDGWNVVSNYVDGSLVVYPIDGDLTTDENFGMFRRINEDGSLSNPLPTTFTPDAVPAYYQTRGVVWGAERPELLLTEGLAWHDRRVQDLELGPILSDEADDFGAVSGSRDEVVDQEADNDMDQRLKPAGRCYVELFNPWSNGALLGAELYRDPGNNFRRFDSDGDGTNMDRDPGDPYDREALYDPDDDFLEGLLIDRITDGVSNQGLPSPVWRMACTETHPLVRNATIPDQFTVEVNDDPITTRNRGEYLDLTIENGPWAYETDERRQYGGVGGEERGTTEIIPSGYLKYYNKFYRAFETGLDASTSEVAPRITDPDFPSFDRLDQPEDFASSRLQISNIGLGNGYTGEVIRRILFKPRDYIERLFYFTGAPSQDYLPQVGEVRDLTDNTKIGLHIPQLFYEVEIDKEVLGNVESAARGDSIDLTLDGSGGERFSLEDDGLEIVSIPGENGREPSRALRVHISRFVALDYFDADGDHPSDRHDDSDGPIEPVPLAPILPGRYAVVGTAGEVFGKNATAAENSRTGSYDTTTIRSYDNLEDRYTSILTRSLESQDRDPANSEFIAPPLGLPNEQVSFRRIEMIPSTNPNRQQFIFRMNGGLKNESFQGEHVRTSEVVDLTPADLGDQDNDLPNGVPSMVNLTDPVQYEGGTPIIKPIVGIPMEGFTISEPLDGYLVRQLELDPELKLIYYKDPRIPNTSERPAQGAYVNGDRDLAGYDEPFDLLPELIENQTTPNYRTMHLQRLANPLLAWNPPPISGAGELDPQHDPTRPVNPYLTSDSLSLDLTSSNSTSTRENELALTPAVNVDGPEERHQVNRNQLPQSPTGSGGGSGRPYTRMTLQSQERGLHVTAEGTNDNTPSRMLWNQDRPTGTSELLQTSRLALNHNQKIHSEAAGLNAKDRYSFGTDESLAGVTYKEAVIDFSIRHSLGFSNRTWGKFYNFVTDVSQAPSPPGNPNVPADVVDLNGDGDRTDLLGVPEIDAGNMRANDDVTTPVFHWPNRPFISEAEVMLAPIWGSSRMLTYYSIYNPALSEQPNRYDGTALLDSNGDDLPLSQISIADAEVTNDERWDRMHTTYGHLPNFLATANESSKVAVNADNDVVAYGAPHFYRILDYLHVPSRFIGTDELLTPEQFTTIPTNINDPRRELVAPFNRIDNYREPGRVNLNTIAGRGDDTLGNVNGNVVLQDSDDRWSEVYDGIMHRRQDANILFGTDLLAMGHLGPAWRDIEKSRRGYLDSTFNVNEGVLNHSPLALNSNFPTFFANPFRSPGEGANVPLPAMRQGGVATGLLRAHHFSPGPDSAWGERNGDFSNVTKSWGESDQIANDAGQAYAGNDFNNGGVSSDDTVIFEDTFGALPELFYDPRIDPITGNPLNDPVNQPRIPLMSGASLEPSLDTERNPHLRYQPMTRLANLTSTRSGVFAVWITVGFFEVTSATENTDITSRYFNLDADGNVVSPLSQAAEELFFRIYPDGYMLGKEVGLDTGETQRHRGFYIVDRTLPVAFKPGEDLNVDETVLLRRRIE